MQRVVFSFVVCSALSFRFLFVQDAVPLVQDRVGIYRYPLRIAVHAPPHSMYRFPLLTAVHTPPHVTVLLTVPQRASKPSSAAFDDPRAPS